MPWVEKRRTLYLNDTAIVIVKIRSVNMTYGWGIKTLPDKVNCFYLNLMDFKPFLMMDPVILQIFCP